MSEVNGTGAGSNGSDTRVVDAARGRADGRADGRGPLPTPSPDFGRRRLGLGASEFVVNTRSCDLASAEGDDATGRVVGRDTHGHPVAWDDLNTEAAHPATQLGQHFVAGIHLHTIQTAAMHGDHGALDINEIVLAQIRSPFKPVSITERRAGPYLMEIPAESRTTFLRSRPAVTSVGFPGFVR